MPKLGADMTAGKLIAWHKKPGDTVRRGEIVAEVETDKGVIGIEIFVNGTLEKLLVAEGETVPVGTTLAAVREEGTAAAVTVEAPKVGVPAAPVTHAPGPAVARPSAAAERLRISPSARHLAENLGIDPATVQGTGRDGAITREDVERAAATAQAAPKKKPEPDRLTRMRQAIAAAMSRSKREIPHYYLSTTIDLQPALTDRKSVV